MECQKTQDLLSEYIDGLLPARLVSVVESHLSRCDACCQDVKELRQTVAAVRELPELAPPSYFVHAVQARISAPKSPRKSSLLQWFSPSRPGLAIRLVAACILLGALLPPVRESTVHAGWSLLWNLRWVQTPPPLMPASAGAKPPVPQVLPPSPDSSASNLPGQGGVSKSDDGSDVINPTVRQAIVVIPPRPIERPSIPDVSLRFGVDGDLKVGVPVHVSIVASALSDTFDTNIEADVSDGAHFVTDMGNRVVYRGNAVQIWNGVLTGSLSTTMSALVVADRPGAYDLRVTVHSRSGDLASSALYLPISLVPTTYSIDTSKSGPTDLYTALGTLAVESAHPVAVEEGLKGTVQLSVHATNFTASLNSVASQYGCAVVEQGGVANVVLHPETLSSTRKYGV